MTTRCFVCLAEQPLDAAGLVVEHPDLLVPEYGCGGGGLEPLATDWQPPASELAITVEALRQARVRAEQRWPSHRLGPYPDPNGAHQ